MSHPPLPYREILKRLSALIDHERLPPQGPATRVFHLEAFREFLGALGSPQSGLRIVHIAGTRGKGTVATLLSEALARRGHRVGLYRSPHVDDIRERITVDGRWISRDAFARHASATLAALKHAGQGADGSYRTFFECLTAIALLHFAHRHVDWAILETGLGGRLDATNVVDPALTIITALGIDHTRVLGNSLTDIAREKAGILKPGAPCVLGPQPPGHSAVAARVVGARAEALGIEVRSVSRRWDWSVERHSLAGLEVGLSRRGRKPSRWVVTLPSPGLTGASAVATIWEALSVLGEDLGESVERFEWPLPGRFEVVNRRPPIILDGAHCPLAARELARTIRSIAPGPLRICLTMMSDKDHVGFIRALGLRQGDSVALPRRRSARSATPEMLAQAVRMAAPEATSEQFPTLTSALRHLRSQRPMGALLVTGSFYHLAPARRALARIG